MTRTPDYQGRAQVVAPTPASACGNAPAGGSILSRRPKGLFPPSTHVYRPRYRLLGVATQWEFTEVDELRRAALHRRVELSSLSGRSNEYEFEDLTAWRRLGR
jgi:hypothetical protein